MLKEIYASNFRSFKEIKMRNLKRINVFTGANGCGKTTLLEIPFLLSGANNARLVVSLYNFRNEHEIIPGYDRFYKDIFHDMDISNTIEMWEATPKFCVSRRVQNSLRDKNGRLPVSVNAELTIRELRTPTKTNARFGLPFCPSVSFQKWLHSPLCTHFGPNWRTKFLRQI